MATDKYRNPKWEQVQILLSVQSANETQNEMFNQNQITRNENTHGIFRLDARNCGVRIRNVLAWYADSIHSERKHGRGGNRHLLLRTGRRSVGTDTDVCERCAETQNCEVK